MKIGIDIRSTLKKTRTGVGVYTINLVHALSQIDKGNQYYLYSRKNILDFKRHLPGLPAANFFHCVDYFKNQPAGLLPWIDIFYTSSYDLNPPKKAKFILTVHDVINKAYPNGHNERTLSELDDRLKNVIVKADILVASSHSTKHDLMKFYNVSDSKIVVIYPGVSSMFKPVSQAEDSCNILFVGTIEPRKNIDGLIKAFDWLKKGYGIKHKLYIVGMKGWMFEKILRAYEQSEFKKDIVLKGYVDNDELLEIYKKASVFVYPSFYEGFGFPVVEAFRSGVPVVTSNVSSCAEVAGDSALVVDPNNYKEIAKAILRLINDEDLKKELIEKGIHRAKGFTWEKTARDFFDLFLSL